MPARGPRHVLSYSLSSAQVYDRRSPFVLPATSAIR